jgi:D-arabinose 1-dehydrogenase-like Zn-dependent alcohol dehydrogenase
LIFKDLRIRGISYGVITKIGSLYASVKDAEEMLRDIAGAPVQVVKRIYEFEQVNEAVEDSKRGGKIVVEFLKEK